MDLTNVERYLDSFGKKVVQDAKANLARAKGSTALGNSIRFEVVTDAQGFSTRFYMDDYGEYLDKGVSGNKQKQSFEDYKGTTRSSPYSYTSKGPPIDIISKWIKKKGIEPKGLGRGFAYLISRKIKREGIKSLSFFQEPLGVEYEKLNESLLKELKLDIETYITTFYRPK